MSKDIKQQLKALKKNSSPLNPDALWVSANKERLLIQTRNTTGNQKQKFAWTWHNWQEMGNIFLPAKTFVAMRSMASVAMVCVLTIGSWIASVSASYNSLPGEALYQVKRATEKTELLVASVIGSDTEKINTLLKHASHRVEEYKNSKSSSQATEVLKSLNNAIQNTNETLNEVNKSKPDKAVQVAQVVNEKTDKILQALDEIPMMVGISPADRTGLIQIAAMPLDQEVQKTSNIVEAAGVRAVQVIVENAGSAQSAEDQKDAKAEVEKKLDKVVTDIAQINKDSTASTTSIHAEPITILSASSSTAEVVAEAKDLIEKNDLVGAIKKVQELQVAKGEAQSAAEVKAPVIIVSTTSSTPDIVKPTISTTTITTTTK